MTNNRFPNTTDFRAELNEAVAALSHEYYFYLHDWFMAQGIMGSLRDEYMDALETASVEMDMRGFAENNG